MENNELKKLHIKDSMCYYFDEITRLENFNLDNIWIDKKPQENILIYDISYKILIDIEFLRIIFFKIDGFIRVYDGTRFLNCLVLKNMMLFTTKLDILLVKSHIFFLTISRKPKLFLMILYL